MLIPNFTPFPDLQTERLTLRQLRHSDAPEVFAMRSDEEIMKYIGRPRAKSLDDALQLIDTINQRIEKNEGINWAMTLKGSETIIGIIGYVSINKDHYRAEVGYLLDSKFHRKGIMHEALKTVLDFGFGQMKLHSIEAITAPLNEASQSLLKKNNFRHEAYFREDFYFDGEFLDSVVYSLLASDRETEK